MKPSRMPVLFLAAGLATAALAPSERAALASTRNASLEQMRAGAGSSSRAVVTAQERATLVRAEQAAPELAAMRAGDLNLTNRDLQLIGITALVVVLLVLIF